MIFYCYTDMKHFDRRTNGIIRVYKKSCRRHKVKIEKIMVTYRTLPTKTTNFPDSDG